MIKTLGYSDPSDIEGLILINPRLFGDQRGFFTEVYNKSKSFVIPSSESEFVQDNLSYSKANVVRGMHFQLTPYAQSKLVRCVWGRIQDVVVDLRHDSPSIGKHYSVELSFDNMLQLFIPKGFAHGFAVLSSVAIVEYKCDQYYMPEYESGLRWDDEDLGIKWMIDKDKAIVSDKDKKLMSWKDFLERRLR